MKNCNTFFRNGLLGVAAACALSLPAFAGEMPPRGGPEQAAGPAFHLPGEPAFLRGISLNEVQRDEIFSIVHEQAPAMRQKLKSIRAAQKALDELGLSNRFDEAKARALAEAVAREQAALALQRARVSQMVYAVLNSEQRRELERMKDGRGPGMPPLAQRPLRPDDGRF